MCSYRELLAIDRTQPLLPFFNTNTPLFPTWGGGSVFSTSFWMASKTSVVANSAHWSLVYAAAGGAPKGTLVLWYRTTSWLHEWSVSFCEKGYIFYEPATGVLVKEKDLYGSTGTIIEKVTPILAPRSGNQWCMYQCHFALYKKRWDSL